jgi:hypothetical protein
VKKPPPSTVESNNNSMSYPNQGNDVDIPVVTTATVVAPSDMNGGYQFNADAENGRIVNVQVVSGDDVVAQICDVI